MKSLNRNDLIAFVEEHMDSFHQRRLEKLEDLKLKEILKKKNPYLFKAKAFHTAQDLVKSLLDSYLSSQEETIFGELLEKLAIFVCSKVFQGRKSTTEGIDLEFEKDDIHYIVAIKSGPNWGNSSQIKKMVDFFKRAQRIGRTSGGQFLSVAVNGCCYGKDNKPDKGDYLKLCGQVFWEFISGDEKLYIEIIEPLGYRAKERNERFVESYYRILQRFTKEFTNEFCPNDVIDWEKLVKFNSGKTEVRKAHKAL